VTPEIEENWNEGAFRESCRRPVLRQPRAFWRSRHGTGAEAGAARGHSQPLKQASPAALAAAREILTMKNAAAMYQSAVPNIVEQTKNALIQQNLNYQKDLTEVAPIVAKSLAGREKEIVKAWRRSYANEFSEQELKDLVTFYNRRSAKNCSHRAARHPVQHVLHESVGDGVRGNRERVFARK